MLLSMTGFGRSEATLGDRKLTVEVRSLNSKQLDLSVKTPIMFRDREALLRTWASDKVIRGKAEMTLHLERTAGAKRSTVDPTVVKERYEELRRIADEVAPDHRTDLLGLVLRMPDVMAVDNGTASDDEWAKAMAVVQQAVDGFHAFRAVEGTKLAEDLQGRVAAIRTQLAEVNVLDPVRMDKARQRLHTKLADLRIEVDLERFEQELVLLLEKLDINEEKVRLATHCDHFLATMANEQLQGRKLGFIAQEMGREINTIGSKSNDAAMQHCVVLMKDELERIKEQVLNVL